MLSLLLPCAFFVVDIFKTQDLTVATIDAPPWTYLNQSTGEVEGFCVEVMEHIKKEAQAMDGVNLKYKLEAQSAATYDQVIDQVLNLSQPVNLAIGDFSITAARIAKQTSFTTPIGADGYVVVKSALKSQTKIISLDEVQVLTTKQQTWGVCIKTGTSQVFFHGIAEVCVWGVVFLLCSVIQWDFFSSKYSSVTWIMVDTDDEAYSFLDTGHCELAVMPKSKVDYFLLKMRLEGQQERYIAYGLPVSQSLANYLAFPSSSTFIATGLSKYLSGLHATGLMQQLQTKYFSGNMLAVLGSDNKKLDGKHYTVVLVPDEPYVSRYTYLLI
jgi:ABC-type amino acid transport substrate-binding protein